MIKTFIIFFIILALGYYGFNYYKDAKGIGFRKVQSEYTVRLAPDQLNMSKLTMKKDSSYEIDFCGVSKGEYEIIGDVYNFKLKSTEPDMSQDYCNGDMKAIAVNLRGKFLIKKMDDGGIRLINDNSDQFYLYPY